MKDASRRRKPNKLKLVCSFNGKFQPRSPSGKLRYVGGETRIVSVERNIGYSRLLSKVLELHHCSGSSNADIPSFSLIYRRDEDDSPLVPVTCNDDVTCMMEEYYERLQTLGIGPRLWIFVCYNDNASDILRIIDGDKYKYYYNNGDYDNGKIKKQVKTGNDDSLRTTLLKQQLLAKKIRTIHVNDSRLGIANKMCGYDIGSFSCDDFSNNSDYRYSEGEKLKSEGLRNSGVLPVYHSHPLNLNYGSVPVPKLDSVYNQLGGRHSPFHGFAITDAKKLRTLRHRIKLLDKEGCCKSFIQYQNTNQILDDCASSVEPSLHNLSISSIGEAKPQCCPLAVATEVKLPDIMDEERFSSGPQVEKSSDVTCIMVQDSVKKAENWHGPQYNVCEKDKIKKTQKINVALPADLAAFYTHLATKELQTIDNSDLEYIKELGSGAYGTVYHGKWKGSDVAIKKLKPTRCSENAMDEDRLVADFWKEAHILGQLHHPNIVALYGVVTDGPVSNFAAVTEYMVNGSLKQVLRRRDRTIDRRKRLIIAMDAAFGMEYLHEKNIIHFDLKSHNFLVNMRDPLRPICKIGDLGLSKIKQRTLVSGGVRGTISWMAPELLNSKEMVNEKVDVYSFGIVMWELLTGEEPYASMKSKEIIAGIIKGTLRPETPSWCDPAWRSLMERCWSSEPDARPSFSVISKELRAMAAPMNIK